MSTYKPFNTLHMITLLPFSQSPKADTSYPLKLKKKSNLSTSLFAAVLMIAFAGSSLKAQTSQTIPLDPTVASGTFTYLNAGARNFQLIIDDSQLTALSGKYINSISLKLSTATKTTWPSTDATFSSFNIYLSNGVDPANRVFNFAGNVVEPQTLVRSGSLVIPAGSFVAGNAANPHSFNITFATPWLYNGTNLVIELRHLGLTGASASTVGAVPSANAGYGSLFSACWSSTATGVPQQGTFLDVKINAFDNLGVQSVVLDGGTSVYPNPVKDILNVKSESNISEINVFNTSGQKIHTQRTDTKNPQISVSDWTKGVYFLQTIDKNGNMKSTKFIKD